MRDDTKIHGSKIHSERTARIYLLNTFDFLFFFSSRRRHTRWTGDWSSDVCSSDLDPGNSDGSFGPGTLAAVIAFQSSQGMVADGVVGPNTAGALGLTDQPPAVTSIPGVTVDAVCKMRSEERRVGKECRARGSPEQQ